MTEAEKQIEQAAVRWIRRKVNKQFIINTFASPAVYETSTKPIVIFMAGSPGAGKTEFIKSLRGPFENLSGVKMVVIDPDAIRTHMPGYTGSNSYLFQRSVSIAVDDLFHHIRHHGQGAFIDGTLADYKQAGQNIGEVVNQYGAVMVCYIFQHPLIAWRFTQLREVVEGRNIRRQDFIGKFLSSKDTVNRLKAGFGDKINLNVVLKDYKDVGANKKVAKVYYDVASVDECFSFSYTEKSLKDLLHNKNV